MIRTGTLQLTHNTAWRNGGDGFSMTHAAARLRDNAAVGNSAAAALNGKAQASGNTWDDGRQVTARMFRSTDPASAQDPRRADGALPVTTFLASTSGAGATMRES